MHVVIDPGTCEPNLEKIATIALKRWVMNAENGAISKEDCIAAISQNADRIADVSLCSGHDLLSALAFLMHNRWGSRALSGENLGQIFRSGFDCEHMRQTSVYKEIYDWGSRKNRRLWRCPRVPEQRTRNDVGLTTITSPLMENQT
jgi:hypothetical protein